MTTSSGSTAVRRTPTQADVRAVDNAASEAGASSDKYAVEQINEKNVLYSYRSVTYNWTLAGLSSEYINDPKKLRESELKWVIARSGGKGPEGFFNSVEGVERKVGEEKVLVSEGNEVVVSGTKDILKKDFSGNALVEGFNRESPGRFDLFIENVVVDTLMSASPEGNFTQPTKIEFEIIEPYSINGFFEAIHTAAVATGYSSYNGAVFVLKLEFIGYPDSGEFSEAEIVPKATRYFPFRFRKIDMDVSERGTRYKIECVPFEQRAFGQPNVVKKPIKMTGNNVKEILTDLMNNLSDQAKNTSPSGQSSSNKHDIYEVKFPSRSDEGWQESPENKIASALITDLKNAPNLYKMPDPATSNKPDNYQRSGRYAPKPPAPEQQAAQPDNIKYTPGQTVIQFAENANVHEIISSIVRDSDYSKDILKNIKGNIDQYGMVDYFLIRMEVKNLDEIDELAKRPYQRFTYIVTPYKVHYSQLPTMGSEQFPSEQFRKICRREYNYFYTGQNLDILTFKLQFNSLFFEAVPPEMGNRDQPSSRNAAGNSNGPTISARGTDVQTQAANQVPLPPVQTAPANTVYSGGNAAQPQDDPYALMAKHMHEALINSKSAAMLRGDVEIVGDPFFLVTGGIGNYNPKLTNEWETEDGEAAQTYTEVLISINFRNPIDIDENGMMYFDPKRIPFSGVWKVNKVVSYFRDGSFKQKLEVMRFNGQVLDQNTDLTDPNDRIITKPSPVDQVVPDVSRSAAPTQRLSAAAANYQLQRGLPSPGLPGAQSNFTNATGGLGGVSSDLLVQNQGQVPAISALRSGSSVIGQPLPTDVSSNIRLNQNGLFDMNKGNLTSAALIAVASNVLTGNIPAKRALGVVAGGVIGTAIGSALKKSNPGSGIGEGATVKITNDYVDPSKATSLEVLSGKGISDIKLPEGSINQFSTSVKDLGTRSLNAVMGAGEQVGKYINNLGTKLNSLTGTKTDPEGVGAAAGLDTSKLSGLSGYQSKLLNEIKNVSKSVPDDVNLSQAVNQGLSFNTIPLNKIPNIPPTAPFTTAPTPISDTDVSYITSIAKQQGIAGVENLYGVSDTSKISNNIVPTDVLNSVKSTIPSQFSNPLASLRGRISSIDEITQAGKISSAESQISSLTGVPNIQDGNLAGSITNKFGSLSKGTSPLDKLLSRAKRPDTPSDLNDFYG